MSIKHYEYAKVPLYIGYLYISRYYCFIYTNTCAVAYITCIVLNIWMSYMILIIQAIQVYTYSRSAQTYGIGIYIHVGAQLYYVLCFVPFYMFRISGFSSDVFRSALRLRSILYATVVHHSVSRLQRWLPPAAHDRPLFFWQFSLVFLSPSVCLSFCLSRRSLRRRWRQQRSLVLYIAATVDLIGRWP